MLWQYYVFRRGQEIHSTWDLLFAHRPIRLLYIAGSGFDIRTQKALKALADSLREARPVIDQAKLLLVAFTGYQLSEELQRQTAENAKALAEIFQEFGDTTTVSIGSSTPEEDDISASTALRLGIERALAVRGESLDSLVKFLA